MKGMGGFGKDHKKIVFCLFFIIDVLSPRLSWIERGSLKSLAHDEQLRLLGTQRRNIMNERLFQSDIRMVSEDNFSF